jgi:hypothetical protein
VKQCPYCKGEAVKVVQEMARDTKISEVGDTYKCTISQCGATWLEVNTETSAYIQPLAPDTPEKPIQICPFCKAEGSTLDFISADFPTPDNLACQCQQCLGWWQNKVISDQKVQVIVSPPSTFLHLQVPPEAKYDGGSFLDYGITKVRERALLWLTNKSPVADQVKETLKNFK